MESCVDVLVDEIVEVDSGDSMGEIQLFVWRCGT